MWVKIADAICKTLSKYPKPTANHPINFLDDWSTDCDLYEAQSVFEVMGMISILKGLKSSFWLSSSLECSGARVSASCQF